MSEKYLGVRFKTIFKEDKRIEEERIEKLKFWGKKFTDLNLAPKIEGGFAGNLSFRTHHGFIITASGANLSELNDDDFVEVMNVDVSLKQIFVCGLKEPSSESFLHHAIYIKRQDINVVFHGHDKLTLKFNDMLNFPITKKEQPYGSKELVDEVVKILNMNCNYFLIKKHGFISLGKTIDEAGNNAIEQHKKAVELRDKNLQNAHYLQR